MNFFYYLLTGLVLTPVPDFYNTKQTEHRRKIAIVDTGIEISEKTRKYLCYGKHYDVTGTGIEDKHGHGTNIAGIIAKQMDIDKTCLLIIKYYGTFGSHVSAEVKALQTALEQKASYINLSSGGEGNSLPEQQIIEKLLKQKIYVTVSSGNNNEKLEKENCNYYPACYNFQSKYFHVVGNGKSEANKQQSSNYGPVVTDWRQGKNVEGFGVIMSGSSQSTAIMTGELIK